MISNSLVYFRTLENITQEKLSEVTSLSYSYISKIEAGILDNPSLQAAQAIAAAFRVSLDELVTKDRELSYEAKPFVKWAGGKRQMIDSLISYSPKKYNHYYEPFAGAGALFFKMNPRRAVISDVNPELINAYKVIKNSLSPLIKQLSQYQNNSKFFYQVRTQKPDDLDEVTRAARFIFLNKTCFNGLYRVNKAGEFNVPYGYNPEANICDENSLFRVSRRLQNTKILLSDYKKSLDGVKRGDFVFFDPPYYPAGGYSDFTRYTKDRFYKDDQEELADLFSRLDKKGVYVLATNSCTDYIKKLYRNFNTRAISSRRSISSKSSTRSSTDLIIIGDSLYAKLSS